jgi:UDP-glucuronate 4-epimerase
VPVAVESGAGCNRLFNIGRGLPMALMDFVACLESSLGLTARRNYLPLQAGDVVKTWADTSALQAWIDFRPQVEVEAGVEQFVKWYRNYYQV